MPGAGKAIRLPGGTGQGPALVREVVESEMGGRAVCPGPNNTGKWKATTYSTIRATAKELPNTVVNVSALCEAGCYTPEQELQFGDSVLPIAKAYENGNNHVTTLAPGATLDSLQLMVNDIARWTVDIAPATQEILTFRTKSGGELRVTTEHPVMTSEGVMKRASDLVVGESLVHHDGTPDPIASIDHDQGNVFVAGTFWGTADFAGIPRTSAGWEDIFVVKLDADGNPVWVRTFGDAETQETWDLAADYAGNVVLTGFALGNVDFGDGLRPGAGAPDVIVVKLDGNGQTLWSRRYGDEGMQFGHTITVDAQNNVIVTGEESGAIDFGDGAVGGAGALDFFVVKLDSGGNVVWHRHYGDAANQNGIFGAADRSGAVLLTGSFQGSVDFGGGVLWSAGATDAFVAKLDKDGNFLWSWSMGDAQTQAGTAIAAKSLGRAVVAGKVWGTIDLGGGLSVSGGNITSNAFMLEAEP